MATTEAKVANCEEIINHRFTNQLLCLEALQASGHVLTWKGKFIRVHKNDRMAVLGDTVAKSNICRLWFSTGRSKGQWTQVEQALLGNANLTAVGFRNNLDRCVILNQGTTAISDKTMATTVEAILGAVFIDGGADVLGAVLLTLELTHQLLEAVTLNLLPPHI
ncbi:hypothetical protein LTR84_008076 [Exophiala bonariae]|uniref:RNase III domain-containing protein n=1 Tax=Exophiala bonariae TaxID=1690606 RepID=A0AAV9NPA8_9EURO|nr:hypothetical protein LTR84_008076 [Exophiala bonariae]